MSENIIKKAISLNDSIIKILEICQENEELHSILNKFNKYIKDHKNEETTDPYYTIKLSEYILKNMWQTNFKNIAEYFLLEMSLEEFKASMYYSIGE